VVGHGTAEYEFRRALEKHHGASMRDRIRGQGVRDGKASLLIDFRKMPKGVRTASTHEGLFKEVRLNRGRPMGMASENS
jgi:hypothetical protein